MTVEEGGEGGIIGPVASADEGTAGISVGEVNMGYVKDWSVLTFVDACESETDPKANARQSCSAALAVLASGVCGNRGSTCGSP